MNKIKDVYSHVTVDSDTVIRAIENAKKEQIRRFPVKRIIAIAASFMIVTAAAAVAIFMLNHQTQPLSAVYGDKMQLSAAGEEAEAFDGGAENGKTGGSDIGGASSLYVSYAVSTADGVLVEYRISKDSPYDDEVLSAVLVDENGDEIRASDESVSQDSEGNQIVTVHFPPCKEKELTLRFCQGETVLKEEPVTLTE